MPAWNAAALKYYQGRRIWGEEVRWRQTKQSNPLRSGHLEATFDTEGEGELCSGRSDSPAGRYEALPTPCQIDRESRGRTAVTYFLACTASRQRP